MTAEAWAASRQPFTFAFCLSYGATVARAIIGPSRRDSPPPMVAALGWLTIGASSVVGGLVAAG
jgi:hypothetical protein